MLIGSECKYMKEIIELKILDKNVEIIFYNGKQAEYDFSVYGS